jgi:chemotaxis methyl-accepting protein methylase
VSTIAVDLVESTPAERDAFHAILRTLHEHTGTDFGCYRPSTIMRRVRNRMISVGANSFCDYLVLLHGSDAEALRLLERVTIKVSRFYRNREVFDVLRKVVLPELSARNDREPVRIWSAGCGFGEEPYTLAMLLEEAGVEGGIVATDIDEGALHAARAARYRDSAVEELPADLRERYLERIDGGYRVNAAIRERVQFVRGDLTRHAACARMPFDLVCCRNVLIYLAHEVQRRVVQTLIDSLRPGGYLCLGEAEWPGSAFHARLEPLGHKSRLRLFRASRAARAEAFLLGGERT